MNFFGKLNKKCSFGMFNDNKNINMINIVCGVLLIILIIILIICLVRKGDNFSNNHEDNDKHNNEHNNEHKNHNKKHKLVSRDGCPFCINAKKLLTELNIDYDLIDANSPEGIELMKLGKNGEGVNGVPFMKCADGSEIIGFDKEKYNNLKNSNEHNNNNKKHKLVSRDGCPFCINAKKLLTELNIDYDLIDANSPEGIELMKLGNNGEGVNGVPFMKCADGTEIIGFDKEKYNNLK